jgi:hypothetical protein
MIAVTPRRRKQIIVLVSIVAALSLLPAITIPGWPRRWVDPAWIEGLATAWAVVGAAYVIRIELRRDERQFLLDAASGYVTWSIHPTATSISNPEGTLTTMFVHNYGRFPITDAHVILGEHTDRSAHEVTVPIPIAPGSPAEINGGEGADLGQITLYFTAMANGHR